MQEQAIPEFDVLIAVVKWLHSSGWTIENLSLPIGQKINSVGNRKKLADELIRVGIDQKNIRLLSKGEDIRARLGNNLWKIECKGLGTGVSQTIKENFDRAIASVVSYYTQKDRLRLGLAVPEDYLKFFVGRVPQALREAINLWIMLYVSSDEIYVFTPDEEMPKSR